MVELPAEAVEAGHQKLHEQFGTLCSADSGWCAELVAAQLALMGALPVIVAAVRAEERQAIRARIAAQIEEAYSVEGALEGDDCTYAAEIARGDHGDWEPGTLPGSRYVPVEVRRSEASQ